MPLAETRRKDTVYYTYHSPKDDQQRYHFTMEWWQEKFHAGPSWRAQCFFTDPLPYMARQRAAGLRIKESRDYGATRTH